MRRRRPDQFQPAIECIGELDEEFDVIERQPRKAQAQDRILPTVPGAEVIAAGAVDDGAAGIPVRHAARVPGALVFATGAILAPRCSEGRVAPAVCADPSSAALGITGAAGLALLRLVAGLDDRAGAAEQRTVEGRRGAPRTKTGRPPCGVRQPVGGPARLKTGAAARCAVDGPAATTPNAEARRPARPLSLPGAAASGSAFGGHRLASVGFTGVAGFGVSFAITPTLALAAIGAQSPFRLARMPGALATESLGQTFGFPGPGALVLGLPGLGAPDPPDAGGAAFRGAGPVGDAALLGARIADRAPGSGSLPAAARTQALGHTLRGSPPGSLAVEFAPPLGIGVSHGALRGRGRTPSDGRRYVHGEGDVQRLFVRSPNRPHAA